MRTVVPPVAIALKQTSLSSFVPTGDGFEPLAEVVLDLSGHRFSLPAELSILAGAVPVTDTLFVARVERFFGLPRLVVVSLAEVQGDRIVTRSDASWPGILAEGRYVFYRTGDALAQVSGSILLASAPRSGAVVQAAGIPVVGISDDSGTYRTLALAGDATLTARVPGTSLSGEASVLVTPPAAASVDITLEGTATTAVVRPADGEIKILPSTPVEIETTTAFDAETLTPANLRLVKVDGAPVTLRIQVSASRRLLSLIPEGGLAWGTQYRLETQNLLDDQGGAVLVPATSFTTNTDEPEVYDLTQIQFSFPDAQGLIHVTAPHESLAATGELLIIRSSVRQWRQHWGSLHALFRRANAGDRYIRTNGPDACPGHHGRRCVGAGKG